MDVDPAYAELIGKLNSLRTTERKKALRKSLRAMGELVQGAIKERAPVTAGRGNGKKYGAILRDGPKIQIRIQSDENAALYSDRVAIAYPAAAEHIARLVETGHENRRGKKGGNQTVHGRTEPHPFVRPAFDATKEAAEELFAETMAEEIAKVMNG